MLPPTDNIDKTFVLLSLGSNLGSRKKIIETALSVLVDAGIIFDTTLSSFYSTEPVGFSDQPEFINAAISAYTDMPFADLLCACKSVEYFLGRTIRKRWHEREIDIDLLLYGDTCFGSKKLTIPHPRMHERRFVLEPAAEIAATVVHPVLNKSIESLLEECTDNSGVTRL